jgi:hypothetical protein
MTQSRRIAPPNSLLFIEDIAGGEPPRPVRDAQILSTPSCVSVACLAFMDGETEMVLGPAAEVDPGGKPAFDGIIATPSRKVAVTTVEGEAILVTAVPDTKTRVRVWTNRTREPDRVLIGVG